MAALLLLLLVAFPAFAQEGESSSEEKNRELPSLLGDLNSDGVVSAADAALALRVSSGKVILDGGASNYADPNSDLRIDRTDALAILLYADGLVEDFSSVGNLLSGDLLGEQYADRFSYNGIVRSDDFYRSSKVSITNTVVCRDKSNVFISDIYIRDISSFQTGFGDGVFNTGMELTGEIAKRYAAIVAINGDTVSNKKRSTGPIVRNGELYVDKSNKQDECLVLYRDGRMICFPIKSTLSDMEAEGQICQTWNFGPNLLDEQGKAKTTFISSRRINPKNPRTAVGYYEPGHYVFVVADGRQKDSRGLTLEELSNLFEELGCSLAYNLDGGQTSIMASSERVINSPYNNGRGTTDILLICEPDPSLYKEETQEKKLS